MAIPKDILQVLNRFCAQKKYVGPDYETDDVADKDGKFTSKVIYLKVYAMQYCC